MLPQDWEDVLDQAATLGCRAVQFIGGEPTMYPTLPGLIARARQLGFEIVEIYTNGTAFKPRIKNAFLRHNVALAFSVYAENPEIHDLVTRQRGSLERTLASIRWALASGLAVRVGIIEMDQNRGLSQHTEAVLRSMGVTQTGIDRARGIGRGKKEPASGLQFDQLCGGCAPGKLAVTATGEIFPCVFSRFWPVGHVRDGLRAVVESAPLNNFQKAIEAERHSRRLNNEDGRQTMVGGDDDVPLPCPPIPCEPKMPPPPPDCMPTATCGPKKPCTPWGPTCQPKMRPGSAASEQA
jgi:Radical SAM superfamily